ncbi:hypothetical protein JYK14_19850 [Siccirubricoccus sp. KC 17139]|uniref:O-antigen ligase domain-containing protein n=1 Tax=Siccirubricoccus soli TaxID=2899147 RepID=A0ABT1D8Y3_9PROT|nr:hypothetical protein [Siccirubricoccus soli]MCO6418400.1 hypothetical protein [Siccirubricoccus soli]MCP2684535.1 hypothetical protein [Siccirubricoccus soli]
MSASTVAPRRTQLSLWRFWNAEAAVAAGTALLLPLGFQVLGLAGFNRTLYPLIAFAVAGWLHARRSPWYLGLCIWLFAASPMIRRMADYDLGYEPSSTVLLAPYVACLWAGVTGVPYMLRPGARYAGAFLALFACIVYGVLVAVFQDRLLAAMVESLKWVIGPFLALHILADASRRAAYRHVVVLAFVLSGVLMALYGIHQFVSPTAWDIEWVSNVRQEGMTSIGTPEPYGIRVFSTMHSAGSLGAFLMAAMLFALALPVTFAVPSLLPIMLAIGLAQYRAIWAGTVLAIGCVALIGPVRERGRILMASFAVILSLGALSTVPEMEYTLGERFRSLTELRSDASGEDRLQQYEQFLGRGEELLTGYGLGTGSGSLVGQTAGGPGYIDGGLLVTCVALGLPAALVFFCALFLIVVRVVTLARKLPGEGFLYAAIVVGWIVQLPFGAIHAGEHGIPAWLAIGLALAGGRARAAELGGQR